MTCGIHGDAVLQEQNVTLEAQCNTSWEQQEGMLPTNSSSLPIQGLGGGPCFLPVPYPLP